VLICKSEFDFHPDAKGRSVCGCWHCDLSPRRNRAEMLPLRGFAFFRRCRALARMGGLRPGKHYARERRATSDLRSVKFDASIFTGSSWNLGSFEEPLEVLELQGLTQTVSVLRDYIF
jgi:hypothetical protein